MLTRIKPLTRLLLCFHIALLSAPLSAQELEGSHLQPYHNKWKMYAVDPNGNETLLRIWTDYAQQITLNGKEYISRIQELYGPDMHLQELWTNLFEKETMLPYRASQFKTTGDYLYIEFDGKKVINTTKTSTGEPVRTELDSDVPLHDWTLYGVLLSAVEFEKGKTTKVPVFLPQPTGRKAELVITVEDKETVTDDRGRQHETWGVSTNFGLTFWLSKEAPYVIQLTLPGQNGAYNIWRMY